MSLTDDRFCHTCGKGVSNYVARECNRPYCTAQRELARENEAYRRGFQRAAHNSGPSAGLCDVCKTRIDSYESRCFSESGAVHIGCNVGEAKGKYPYSYTDG